MAVRAWPTRSPFVSMSEPKLFGALFENGNSLQCAIWAEGHFQFLKQFAMLESRMDTNPVTKSQDDPLQFDRAEPVGSESAGATGCAGCNRPIANTYYEIGGRVFCGQCREQVIAALRGGSRIARFFKAIALGFIAAMVCAAGWYMIVRLTGYELGIIAIVVGAVVGMAVRRGAGNRGGWVYQGMAILLTYIAITTSYVPPVISAINTGETERLAELMKSDKEKIRIQVHRDGSVAMNGQASSLDEVTKEMERIKSVDGMLLYYREGRGEIDPPASADVIAAKWAELNMPVANCSDPECQNVDSELMSFKHMTPLGKVMLVGISFIIAVQIPFLDLPANILGVIIIGIALWEAWKINKRPFINITGPHQLNPQTGTMVGSSVPIPDGIRQ